MGSQIKELLIGIPVLFFIFWVFTAPVPEERIVRACEPINWVGNLATSTTALSKEDHTLTAARWSDKLNYSCRYIIWRLLYQDEYLKAVEEGRVVPVAGGHKAVEPQKTEEQPVEPEGASEPASAPATPKE